MAPPLPMSALIEPSAYAVALSKEQLQSYCSYCLRRDNNANNEESGMKRCSACKSMKYCSAECQKADWKLHRGECNAIKTLGVVCDDGLRLVSRIKTLADGGELGEIRDDFIPGDDATRSLATLQSHSDDFEARLFSQEYQEFFGKLTDDEEEAKVIEIFKKVAINSFAVGNQFGSPIGIALCIKLSVANHSCKPVTRVVFRNRAALLVPTDKRKMPTSLENACHSYIDELQPIALRRKLLRMKYKFECECEGCCDEDRNSRMEAWNCGICVDGWMKNEEGSHCELCGWEMTRDHFETCRLAEEATKNARITLQRDDLSLQVRVDLSEKLTTLMADTLHKYNVLRLPVLRILYGSALFQKDLENSTRYGIELLDIQKQYQSANDVAILYHKYGLAQVMIALEAWESAQELLDELKPAFTEIYGADAQVVHNIMSMLEQSHRA